MCHFTRAYSRIHKALDQINKFFGTVYITKYTIMFAQNCTFINMIIKITIIKIK